MDVGRALTFVFQDPSWPRKALIGVCLLLLPNLLTPIVSAGTADGLGAGSGLLALLLGLFSLAAGLVVSGYALRIARQVSAGTDLPLPEWAAWGRLFLDGLKAFVVALIWFLVPAILAAVAWFGFWVGALAGGDGAGGDGGAPGIGALLGCLTLLFFLALYVVFPAALTRLATTGSIGEGVNVPAVVSLVRSNFGDYVVILLLQVVVGLVLGVASIAVSFAVGAATGGVELGVINWPASLVGALVSTAVGLYLGAFAFHLYGQAYYRANRGPVLPPGATYGQIN